MLRPVEATRPSRPERPTRAQALGRWQREASERPHRRPLRLRRPVVVDPPPAQAPPPPPPIADPFDPRWVLAVRTAEQLQGSILPPDRRERLLQIGKMLRLSAFDSNLIIAIVQDQARRGRDPLDCPAAGEPMLRHVPLPPRRTWADHLRTTRGRVVALVAGMAVIETVLLFWML